MQRPVVLAHAVRAAALAAIVLAVTACSSPVGSTTCTHIGCMNGLTVRFEAVPPAGSMRVELLPEGESGARYVVECADASRCAEGVRFPGFTDGYAVVRVTTSLGTRSHEVRPAYEERRPNGDDCPPVCRFATVTVPLPA